MTYYKAQTTNSIACCLSCALDKLALLDDDHQGLSSSRNHLSTAVWLMDEHYRTWHSIIWKHSDRITKQRVREQLKTLAYDAYTAFVQAITLLNDYVEEQLQKERNGEPVTPPPPWWNEMLTSLRLAESAFLKEYHNDITNKQLRLF
ncbi:hypothetical protein SD80_012510 [Scytonema tolypothrichoides VB-61278]|nr:hypothetical protein SD80_012510 [Scytonema tolypothrichoides VB-61278]